MSSFTLTRTRGVATVELNRPPVNALTKDSYIELGQIFTQLADDDSLRCVVLTAGGSSAFCAGLDLKEFKSTTSAEADRACTEAAHAGFLAMSDCPVPIVGAIQGPAIGAGCVIASLCDIRISSPRATFGLPEVKVNRIGGGAALRRVLPDGVVRNMVFTGQPLSAVEALNYGFVQAIVAEDQLRSEASKLADQIAANDGQALRLSKKSLTEAAGIPLAEAYAREAAYNSLLFNAGSPEGVQ